MDEVKTGSQPQKPTATTKTKPEPTDVDVLLSQNAEMAERLSKIEQTVSNILSTPIETTPPVVAQDQTEGVTAIAYGTLYCPECHQMLDQVNPSGLANAFEDAPKLYVHPFTASRKLENQQCRLKGKQFKPPRVFMQFMPETKKAKI